MEEKITIGGYRQRKTELPNQVFIKQSPFDCMQLLVMPAMMRDAQPEQGIALAQLEVRAVGGLELEGMTEEMRSNLTSVAYAALLLPREFREAIAKKEPEAMGALSASYRAGDFISINFGLISSHAMLEAIAHKAEQGRLHSDWYQNQLRNNVNNLGAGYHVELGGAKGDFLSTNSFFTIRHPFSDEVANITIDTLVGTFQGENMINALPPLSPEQYAADGLGLAGVKYEVAQYHSRRRKSPSAHKGMDIQVIMRDMIDRLTDEE